MATPFDIANFNLVNFADNYNNIFDSTPADVLIDVKDSTGNITTKTVANRGKFKQQIWDDVGGALGQFNRTFYVDAVNGSDTNDGSSAAPFQTIKKACDTVPVGGYGIIYLTSGQTFQIDVDIELRRKSIFFYESSYGNYYNIEFIVTDDGTYRFVRNFKLIGNSEIGFHGCDIMQIVDNTGSTNGFLYNNKEVFMAIKGGGLGGYFVVALDGVNNLIHNVDGTYFVGSDYNGGSYQISLPGITTKYSTVTTHPYNFFKIYGAIIDKRGSTFQDENGNALTITDVAKNIVKDTNGVPRNVLSNIII